MKPLLITSGEPAGIGPDICLALAQLSLPVVILGDMQVLSSRARQLGLDIEFLEYSFNKPLRSEKKALHVWPLPVQAPVIPGELNVQNAGYVITMLRMAIQSCLAGQFSALITAPVHKAIINKAGIPFTGHTEFLAEACGVPKVVMMLACKTMKVALATTHLPLADVSRSLSKPMIKQVVHQLHHSLHLHFNASQPAIYVAGLNPHAGEDGYLGKEEVDSIIPALNELKAEGINVQGPFPADTMFNPQNLARADVFLAMYHDQGLPVLKYAGFGHAVNITLGLPVIRTSVDHGTALSLAGTGGACADSLMAAVKMAQFMVLKGKVYEPALSHCSH